MKRPRTKATLAARVDRIGVCFFTKKSPKPIQSKKTPHIKCFGKFIPISEEQQKTLESTTTIYMM